MHFNIIYFEIFSAIQYVLFLSYSGYLIYTANAHNEKKMRQINYPDDTSVQNSWIFMVIKCIEWLHKIYEQITIFIMTWHMKFLFTEIVQISVSLTLTQDLCFYVAIWTYVTNIIFLGEIISCFCLIKINHSLTLHVHWNWKDIYSLFPIKYFFL